jgi:hypothetical protein
VNCRRSWIPATETFAEANVLALCQPLFRRHASRWHQQRIACNWDVPAELTFILPRNKLLRIIEQLVAATIGRMPQGGDLDVTAVVSRRGLEVEVADSGESAPDLLPGSLGSVVKPTSIPGETDLAVEQQPCPQGGWAWTVIVPWTSHARMPAAARRAA